MQGGSFLYILFRRHGVSNAFPVSSIQQNDRISISLIQIQQPLAYMAGRDLRCKTTLTDHISIPDSQEKSDLRLSLLAKKIQQLVFIRFIPLCILSDPGKAVQSVIQIPFHGFYDNDLLMFRIITQ